MAAILLAIVAGCSAPSTRPFGLTAAIVYGTVSSSSGTPLGNVHIGASGYPQPCRSDFLGYDGVWTNNGGGYRIAMKSPTVPANLCIAITATPAAGSAVTISGKTVYFKPVESTPYDSVRVDLILP